MQCFKILKSISLQNTKNIVGGTFGDIKKFPKSRIVVLYFTVQKEKFYPPGLNRYICKQDIDIPSLSLSIVLSLRNQIFNKELRQQGYVNKPSNWESEYFVRSIFCHPVVV